MICKEETITERDLYMYRRGVMREYIRNKGPIDIETYHQLHNWIKKGHSVHDNPWGLRDLNGRNPCDYLAAWEQIKTK